MIGRFRRLFSRFRGEERLFTTHKAPFQEPEHAVGEIISWRGRLYRVTRWEELPAVTLERGGTTRTWNVWGIPLTDQEVQAELEQAARAILTEAEASGGERPATAPDESPTEHRPPNRKRARGDDAR